LFFIKSLPNFDQVQKSKHHENSSILLFTFFVCNAIIAQNEILKKSQWSDWKTDTAKMGWRQFYGLSKENKVQ
jgi:hypothetical protein